MAAFDTAITPVASTPAGTSNTTLFTASADTSVLVDVTNIGATQLLVRVGITPGGGSVHWKIYDMIIAPGDSLLGIGPLFLTAGSGGDAVTVRTNTADNAVFSLTGVESS